MDRPPADYREGRRLRAWELSQAGWAQRRIAEALGVTEGAVSQWLKRAREGGAEALRRRIPPGPDARLSAEQRARIPELLARGAESYGFRGDVWTTKRVAAVIGHELGVRYHRGHVSKLLVIWDGLPAHRSRRVREFLSAGAAARLLLERLPGYAPELNPVEDLWHYLKHVELRNCCFPDLDHLWDGLLRAVARVRHRASVLQGFLRHVGYIFSNPSGACCRTHLMCGWVLN
ncbi:MAG TPA: transposase [Chloroflexota bacterium]|nr:transposase [Chloroflexota bacterium]